VGVERTECGRLAQAAVVGQEVTVLVKGLAMELLRLLVRRVLLLRRALRVVLGEAGAAVDGVQSRARAAVVPGTL
jgi:hypothetical protein